MALPAFLLGCKKFKTEFWRRPTDAELKIPHCAQRSAVFLCHCEPAPPGGKVQQSELLLAGGMVW